MPDLAEYHTVHGLTWLWQHPNEKAVTTLGHCSAAPSLGWGHRAAGKPRRSLKTSCRAQSPTPSSLRQRWPPQRVASWPVSAWQGQSFPWGQTRARSWWLFQHRVSHTAQRSEPSAMSTSASAALLPPKHEPAQQNPFPSPQQGQGQQENSTDLFKSI